MNIDTEIERVAEKMRRLPPHSSARVNPPQSIVWGPPLPESRVAAYEAAHGIRLPADYRAFITRVAGSGSHPFYGLEELGVPNSEFGEDDINPGRPFPFTADRPLDCWALFGEDAEDPDAGHAAFEAILEGGGAASGFIHLCHEGCGMNSILVVNAVDPAQEGTVWYFDLANDAGIFPMRHEDGRALTFLSWFELWLDGELSGEPFKGYAELT
ncbi:MAG: SMI1/KNR4 family protein [Actinomycetaceae bacterium]|nr:SMI1/KNR4 family protein [Actinomycetaceae bacterium]